MMTIHIVTGVYGRSIWKDIGFQKYFVYFSILNLVQGPVSCFTTILACEERQQPNSKLVEYTVSYFLNVIAFLVPVLNFHFEEYALWIILLVGGSMIANSWKYIIVSCLKFRYNSFSFDSILPLAVIGACHFFVDPAHYGGILKGATVLMWAYNSIFVLSIINQISTALNINVFVMKKKAE